MPLARKCCISDNDFSGFEIIIDLDYYDSLEEIVSYVKTHLIKSLTKLKLELLVVKATEKKFQSEVEGMEDGFYVFIDYISSYRNTMNHNEQVILKQNDKTNWEIISFDYIWQNRNPKE